MYYLKCRVYGVELKVLNAWCRGQVVGCTGQGAGCKV
jgi:hypothetical protein